MIIIKQPEHFLKSSVPLYSVTRQTDSKRASNKMRKQDTASESQHVVLYNALVIE